MPSTSTKQKLLTLVDEFDIITRELLDLYNSAQQRGESTSTEDLLDLLVLKDKELKETLETANRQKKTDQMIEVLKSQISKRNKDVMNLQSNLKDAEYLLQVSIFQAKQKISNIEASKKTQTSADSIIRYAHRISSSNSVSSPASWVPGDPRRPYPTDMDMRHGHLGRINDLTIPDAPTVIPTPVLNAQPSNSANNAQGSGFFDSSSFVNGIHIPSSIVPNTWKPEKTPTNGKSDDIELMSSETSSSSSSDE